MKRYTNKQLRKMFEAESEEYKREYAAKYFVLPATFEEWRPLMQHQEETGAARIGCKCPNDLIACSGEESDFAERFTGNNPRAVPELLETKNPAYRNGLLAIMRKYGRARRCHVTFSATLCYCDEHQHP